MTTTKITFKEIKDILKEYNKKFIKLEDYDSWLICGVLRTFIGQYSYKIATFKDDDYLYIEMGEHYDGVKEWFKYFDKEDKVKYNKHYNFNFKI
jgi:hypothetical protein